MTDATAQTETRGILSFLADILFGPTVAIDSIPSQRVALTLSLPDGRREILWTRSEPGRTVAEQIDEILVGACESVHDIDAVLIDVSLSEEASRRWLIDLRDARGFFSRVVVMAFDERDAELRARFAAATAKTPSIAMEDLSALHEIGERMGSLVIGSVVEEPISYEDFRKAAGRLVAGLREGRTPEDSGIADVERMLARFDRPA